ncbi:hypothetical protein CJO79_22830 (plasmid) [Ralstonia solanacearum]|nr:hypothetical protein CJO76_22850 [Ralstonia solanacearum]AXV93755.1 hypothetical protein CJO79_22830 [Ralstonia solanacearum]AXW21753.1 hypothetical protein CJO85_22950 [Ralstonia solanacearum]AXW78649.1 hypothetical protein CJO97_22830 [Ralstonia solanacearum]
MHLSNLAGNRKMSDRPKLVYVVALPLVTYVVLTTLWLEWGNLEGAQLFSIVKHLVVVLLLVASLFFYLRVGCWATLAWCAFVPLERYRALFSEFSSVAAGGPWSLAGVDVVRILLLFIACLLSAALVFMVQFRSPAAAQASADA